MTERKTLLNRYGIPLCHLDFVYVKECNDPREMERIVHVLQSGEEGYYPDLTRCAEDKLRLLKPNSRLFRCETKVLRSDEFGETEVQPIKDFSRKVRDRDRRLAAVKDENDILPPVRNSGKISLKGKDKTDVEGTNDQTKMSVGKQTSGKSLNATDYRKWDRYDPDEEILRMELAEERVQEEIERKNRLNAQKSEKVPLIEEINEEQERLKKLTDIERETLSEDYRFRGNEYFRAKEYDSALAEYTRTISLNPDKEAAAYNNRAITYIKLKKYADAIKDCQKCLSIEPNNVKAKYRLGLSYMESGQKEKALDLFTEVLELDPNHTNVKNFISTLRNQIGETAPANATRLQIQEGPTPVNAPSRPSKKKEEKKGLSKDVKESKPTTESAPPKDYDLASVVRPKEIVPNKWMDTAANMMGKNDPKAEQSNTKPFSEMPSKTLPAASDDKEMELRLPMTSETSQSRQSKPLIQEL